MEVVATWAEFLGRISHGLAADGAAVIDNCELLRRWISKQGILPAGQLVHALRVEVKPGPIGTEDNFRPVAIRPAHHLERRADARQAQFFCIAWRVLLKVLIPITFAELLVDLLNRFALLLLVGDGHDQQLEDCAHQPAPLRPHHLVLRGGAYQLARVRGCKLKRLLKVLEMELLLADSLAVEHVVLACKLLLQRRLQRHAAAHPLSHRLQELGVRADSVEILRLREELDVHEAVGAQHASLLPHRPARCLHQPAQRRAVLVQEDEVGGHAPT